MKESVFTPLNKERTERYRFALDDVTPVDCELNDLWQRKRGLKGQVQIHGVIYKVFGTACGLPGCVCDAYIVEAQK